MSFLTGKSASSSSSNSNNGLITSTYSPQMQTGVGANNYLSQLLMGGGSGSGGGSAASGQQYATSNLPGMGGAIANYMLKEHGVMAPGTGGSTTGGGGGNDAQAGYQNYLQNAGYAPAMTQLSRNITGQGAASGILNSGTTAKALQSRGADLNSQFFNNYLQQLSGLSTQGLQAGGLVSGAGQTSQSQGGSPGLLGSIGSVVGGIGSIFSDRRVKHHIVKIGEEPDGLGIYRFSYLGQTARLVGVMAQEVAKLRPWALGRKIAGYYTVNYGAL